MDPPLIRAVPVALAGPVLGLLALTAVRRLEGQLGNPSSFQQLIARVYALEQRLSNLEKAATGARTSLHPAAEPTAPLPARPTATGFPPTEQVTSPATSAPPPPLVPSAIRAAGPTQDATFPGGIQGSPLRPIPPKGGALPVDLESLIAGRWFNRIGIVALLIAVSYFLKLAFDNEWIGKSGRIAIGVMLGGLMLPWSQWLLAKGYTYFSEGIAALGEATLFLSVWAGCQYYTLYSRDVGFAAMIAITAAMAAVAIGRSSQRIAVLSLLGGLLTPILASSGKDQQVVLFTYLLLLGSGTLVMALMKAWRS